MNPLLSAILAPCAKLVYQLAWALFDQFCNLHFIHFKGIASLPLHQHHLCLYISYLSSKGMASTTILSYTSALGHIHRLLSLTDPTKEHVQKILCAAIRIKPSVDS